ncbi:hypothetical protein ABZP36_004597 [Zizania latifolia]
MLGSMLLHVGRITACVYVARQGHVRSVKCDSSVLQNLLSMGGTLECLAGLFTGGGDHHGHKNKTMQLQTVDLKVRMDCEGCELKVKNALSSLKGVESVEVSRKQQKVTVAGYVDASKVLKRAQSTGKKAELWPHVPYGAAYDRRAPPGHVRNAEASAAYVSGHAGGAADRLTNLFNDDDPNSCSVM